jgi:hypothetical protein
MSGKCTQRIILLLPSELRAAAKAMRIIHNRMDIKEKPTPEEMGIFFNLVAKALWHLSEADADSQYIALAIEPNKIERAEIIEKPSEENK